MQCRICGNRDANARFQPREMFFGFRETFTYFQCSRCGCLQISEFPPHMEKYYPPSYYAADESLTEGLHLPSWAATMMGGPLLSLATAATASAGDDTEKRLTEKVLDHYFSGMGLNRESRILDVGTGMGAFLRSLSKLGYRRLLGIDRFIPHDLKHDNGLAVLKGTIAQVPAGTKWDLIMLHHSFEHMEDPLDVMRSISDLLAPDGTCCIRMPIVPNHACRRYGVNWAGFDAPRHFFIHSKQSLATLAAASSLRLERVVHDSTSFQFWASEQYAKDIPLCSDGSFAAPGTRGTPPKTPSFSGFSLTQMAAFERKASDLNIGGQGDQAAFYLRRVSAGDDPPLEPTSDREANGVRNPHAEG